ncbi:ATP-dependent zinc metalloprotease FtsH [Turicibacter bilis]|uniref:ATP-dependent zinc metalloprotease FtsH n=1 Tax=Turicibacter bilis TaxID=2735723 RepID=A0A9Q9CRQ0_9FIRM|nr:ATP-dependent zinc metalloprotease FtsH [Turicibacter bilis]MBS3198601.1 ATP-dependent metallopeptidase FtsH/Yme1/Tma family protein [Turicibacter bilis]UUF09452.1 ATP-dependent zinc metalloprotease FtsH [Turicibacter bilis]
MPPINPKDKINSIKKKSSFNKKGPQSIGIYFILFIIVLGLYGFIFIEPEQTVIEEPTYNEFVTQIENGNVLSMDARPIDGEDNKNLWTISGKMKVNGKETPYTIIVADTAYDKISDLAISHNVSLTNGVAPTIGKVWSFLSYAVLTVLFLGVIMFMFRSAQRGNNKAFDFGKSRAKLSKQEGISFDDVAGNDEEKEELVEVVDFLKSPAKYNEMGARVPKGILLVGPPGTGKTLLARAVAGEAGVPFYSISGSDFVEMFVGVGASRVRDMFQTAKKTAPCIIFIDEIDAVGRQRGAGMGGGHDEREQTLNQLLVEMDGFGPNSGIIVMAATNRPDVLDPALLRPGRFDRQITIGRPDVKGREAILRVHARNKRLAPEVRLEDIARRTPGFSGADLENLLNESALLAARDNRKQIQMKDVDEATDRVMMGPAKKSKVFSKKERRVVAYHEAGHAVVGIKLENAEVVHKVTIIPRGEAGGYALMLPEEETYLQTKQDLLDRITGLLAGRVSEEITFNEVTTGAHNDFQKATAIARAMVTEYGMSDLGPIQYEQRSGNVFLGRDYNKDKNFSDHLARQIDEEIHKIISECYNRCRKVLLSNQDLVKLIAETLLQYETLTKEQIDELVEKGKLETTAYSVADSKEDKKQPKFKLVREGNYKLKSTLTVSKEKLPIIDLTKE